MNRRLYDGGRTYPHNAGVESLNTGQLYSAALLGAAQLFFIVNLVWTQWKRQRVEENPWRATTLEWMTSSPPSPHGNFETTPVVMRGPYEYSVPGALADFLPQADRPAAEHE